MRFTRAAKVAAFPLLAMVLVVALIACQAGPPGKDATAVPGTTGTTGTTGAMGVNALNPVAGDDVIFNDKALPAVFAAADVRTIDLDPYFVGGNRVGIKYTMSPLPLPSGLMPAMGVAITDNMLVVTPNADSAPTVTNDANPYRNVHVIIRATDADDRIADNVIAIRRNKAPTINGMIEAIRIGTQPDAIMVGTQDDLFGNRAGWTCTNFNKCTVALTERYPDNTPTDKLKFTATPTDSDKFMVASVDTGISLTGAATTAKADGTNEAAEVVEVTTNATDTGMLEIAADDRLKFNVNVDGQPEKVRDIADVVLERYGPLGVQYMGRAATAGLPAFFQDPEEKALTFTFSYDDATIVNARLGTAFDHDELGTTPEVSPIELRSLNVGTAVVTVRATEPPGGDDGIGQYVEGTFTVTVNP
jgi:hypothetical protein